MTRYKTCVAHPRIEDWNCEECRGTDKEISALGCLRKENEVSEVVDEAVDETVDDFVDEDFGVPGGPVYKLKGRVVKVDPFLNIKEKFKTLQSLEQDNDNIPVCFGEWHDRTDWFAAKTCSKCSHLTRCSGDTEGTGGTEDNGTSGSHYQLPSDATELKHLIWYKKMNAQIGEAFRKLYRLGEGDRNSKIRDLNGVIAYCEQEKERLQMYGE